jgi:DNA-binding IclR family transcriptional regulator
VKEDSKYRLSLQFLDIGSHVRNQFNNYDVIKEELDSLAKETNEVAQFGIEEHGKVSYLYKATGSQGVVTASSVGTTQPMHSTSLGKSILAYMPDEEVRQVLDQCGLPEQTENTITEREELSTELEEVRKQEYAKDDQENVTGLRCIGAPVIGKDGVFGAVSVSGPSSRINDKRFEEELPIAVKSAANVIELNSKFG